MTAISVTKCHGTGNDFVLLDARAQAGLPYAEVAQALCQRRFSIGADGLLVLSDAQSAQADAAMRIFNPDGSEGEMCGNGIRCVARYLYEENPERTQSSIETMAGLMRTAIVTFSGHPGVRVEMGVPRFLGAPDGQVERTLGIAGEAAPAYAVSMGNPHVVVFVNRETPLLDLPALAATVAGWQLFPAEPNLEIARVHGDEIVMRVHERGVGETWACGTGACAASAAAIASGRARSPVTVTTAGGSVRVTWEGSGTPAFLTGDAELVFRTEIDLPVPAAARNVGS